MAQTNKNANKQRKKLTREERAAKIAAAEERERRAKEQRAGTEKLKKIGIVIVCVILVFALGIPTVALSVLSL